MTHDAPTDKAMELLPCPLHGGKAHLSHRSLDERSGYNITYTIGVECCTLAMTGSSKRNKLGWIDDPQRAGRAELITAWNTRALPTEARADGLAGNELIEEVADRLRVSLNDFSYAARLDIAAAAVHATRTALHTSTPQLAEAGEAQLEAQPSLVERATWFRIDPSTGEWTGEYCSVKPADDAHFVAMIPVEQVAALQPAPDQVEALREAVECLLPWVEEWAEISDYPPGKSQMRGAIRDARAALAAMDGQRKAKGGHDGE